MQNSLTLSLSKGGGIAAGDDMTLPIDVDAVRNATLVAEPFPYLMVQRGRRAVYAPEAHAWEKPTPTNETEYRRKVRMFEHCWLIVVRGKMLRRLGPLYALEIISHRLLRYGSGLLHVVLLATSLALVTHGWIYDVVLAGQVVLLLAAAAGVGIARYYVLVSSATLVALWNYLRRGVPATWQPAHE